MKEPPVSIPSISSLRSSDGHTREEQEGNAEDDHTDNLPTSQLSTIGTTPSPVSARRGRPRSNIAALLEESQVTEERPYNEISHNVIDVNSENRGPAPVLERQPAVIGDVVSRNFVSQTIIRSLPTEMDDKLGRRPIPLKSGVRSRPHQLQSKGQHSYSPRRASEKAREEMSSSGHNPQTSGKGKAIKGRMGRRCMSSKELGTLAPPTQSSYSDMLIQREQIEANLQERLMNVRRSSSTKQERSLTPSPTAESTNKDVLDLSGRRRVSGRNESRNRRRAEHNRAVVEELCDIVTDLFIEESKLLNAQSYGIESTFHREQLHQSVSMFVHALPQRYALGVDTPSEVLLHMRLMAAARANNLRAVVHIASCDDERLEPSKQVTRKLVTISCADAQGLLEYITGLLSTGGSRVLDADVMLSSDSIVLDRFVVQMNGRLRLDMLVNSIEAFIASHRDLDHTTTESGESSSPSESEDTRLSESQGPPPGPLYYHRPPEASPSRQEITQEIERAVPLTSILSANNTAALGLSSSSLHGVSRDQRFSVEKQQPTERVRSEKDKKRTLVNREAINFDEKSVDASKSEQSLDFVSVPAQPKEQARQQEHHVPLIPFEDLMLIETLGTGRVSTIYRAAWQQARPKTTLSNVDMVALKVATVNSNTGDTAHVDELRREADIAAILEHPNICHLAGVAADDECFCLAYEFCEGGSLLSLLADTSRYYEYLPIALDIAHGMAYLHSRNVIHRDLKPSNILLSRDHRAKVADFGMSVANTGQELTAETGTYRYMSPEVIRHESYSSNADVYSFGIVLWQLITREIPFATMTPIQAAFSVAEGRRPSIPPSCPPRLREIIEACWDQDSHKRPSFTYIAMALADYARMAFSPANVGAQTLQIANELLATVDGNSTVNVDFSTPVEVSQNWLSPQSNDMNTSDNIGLEI